MLRILEFIVSLLALLIALVLLPIVFLWAFLVLFRQGGRIEEVDR